MKKSRLAAVLTAGMTILSCLLNLCVFTVNTDFTAYATDDTEGTYGNLQYETKDGYVVITNCDASMTEIKIPSEIDGMTVKKIGWRAFYECENLTSVTIPDSVTEIGYASFMECESLTGVTIPDSVTSIGGCAFEYCTNLETVKMSDNIEYIGDDAFTGTIWYDKKISKDPLIVFNHRVFDGKNCTGKVIIPDGVTIIAEDAFSKCSTITDITFPDTLVTIKYCAFQECDALTGVTFPDSLLNIEREAFSECTAMRSIAIPSSVKFIGGEAFSGCSALSEISFKGKVEKIEESAFRGIGYITDLSGDIYFNGSNDEWKKLGGAYTFGLMGEVVTFNDGTFVEEPPLKISLKEEGTYAVHGYFGNDGIVIIPDEIDGIPVTTISNYAFMLGAGSDNSDHEVIILGKNIKDIEPHGLMSAKRVLADYDNPYFCNKDGVLFTSDMKELVSYPHYEYFYTEEYNVPSSVEVIRSFAFSWADIGCVTISSPKITLEEMAFLYSNILEVNIQSLNISLETFIFYDCIGPQKLVMNGNISYDNAPIMGEELTAFDFFKFGSINCEIFGAKGSDAEKFAESTEKPFIEIGSDDDYSLVSNYVEVYGLYRDHAEFIALKYWDYESDEDFCIPEEMEGLPVTSVRANAFSNSIYLGNVLPKSIHYPKCIEYIGDLPYWFDHLVIENPNCIIGEIPRYEENDNRDAVIYCPDNSKITNTVVDAGYTVVPLYKYPGIIKGDVNLDGQVSIADAVMLQKWLLGASDELTCWQNVDLCYDERIDVFDLCILKRLLIEKSEY